MFACGLKATEFVFHFFLHMWLSKQQSNKHYCNSRAQFKSIYHLLHRNLVHAELSDPWKEVTDEDNGSLGERLILRFTLLSVS
jgi:hypothetical protein